MSSEALESSPVTKRKRTGTQSKTGRRKAACQICRLRKVACDNARPQCSLCRSSGSECTYLDEANEPLTLDRAVQLLSGQISGLSAQVAELRTSSAAAVVPSPTAGIPQRIPSFFPGPDDVEVVQPELSRTFAEIPAHRTTADTVLTWPVYENAFPANFFIEQHLSKSSSEVNYCEKQDETPPIFEMTAVSAPLDEQQIPSFVDRFLENVHTKNPVLDVESLVKKSREYSQNGLRWDAWSCLLLITCALGAVAKTFGSEVEASNVDVPLDIARQIAAPMKDRLQAENCFALACRRLALLQPSLVAAQCYFFAGVYLMYTLRPMLSWQHFHQASIVYMLYLRTNGRLAEDNTILVEPNTYGRDDADYQRNRLEQRLYWSCFKSECEFRVELPLPQSEISMYEYPNLFPSPPSPPVQAEADNYQSPVATASQLSATTLPISATFAYDEPIDDTRMHAKRLCNEEESWYYYLTEVALRRIGNRIINTFFRHDRNEWLQIEAFVDLAVEFETQVSQWSANLPPAMQKYETNSTIRAPRLASADGAESGFVSQELSWATENRLLEMRSWLYQPFLYYLVHTRPPRPAEIPSLDGRTPSIASITSPSAHPPEMNSVFWNLILRAVDCNITILDTRSVPHRHHGLWYDLRAIVCASLILIAVVRSGYIDLIPGGRFALVEDSAGNASQHSETISTKQSNRSLPVQIRGKFGKVLRQLDIWSNESPDMVKHRDTLERLIHQTFDPMQER